MGRFNKLYIILYYYVCFSWDFTSISINLNVFQLVCHAKDTGSMRGIKQDHLPFYYHSESESLIDEKLAIAGQTQNVKVGFDIVQ